MTYINGRLYTAGRHEACHARQKKRGRKPAPQGALLESDESMRAEPAGTAADAAMVRGFGRMSSRHRNKPKDLCKNNNLYTLSGMAYVSEATRFLDDLLDKHPELRELRKRNRATWWDHPQELEMQQERDASRVAQGAYVYFPPAQAVKKPGA